MQQPGRNAEIDRGRPRSDQSSASAAGLAVAVVVAGVLYGYSVTLLDLPEQIELLLAAGVVIGLAVGRWPAVAAAAPVAIAIWFGADGGGQDAEAATLLVYLPAAAVSVAVGVALRLSVARLRRPSQ